MLPTATIGVVINFLKQGPGDTDAIAMDDDRPADP